MWVLSLPVPVLGIISFVIDSQCALYLLRKCHYKYITKGDFIARSNAQGARNALWQTRWVTTDPTLAFCPQTGSFE